MLWKRGVSKVKMLLVILENSELVKTFFLGGRENPAMDGSGQGLFWPHAELKPKGGNEWRTSFGFIAENFM